MQFVDRLGEFYLGRHVDAATMAPVDTPYLYTSADLTTHAMIVGMTGSGKTGLGIALLEEAILDDLPALVIDPKGDMTNLLLADPALSGPMLERVVSPQAAKGLSVAAYAEEEAARWTAGWAEAGMDAARVATLAASDRTVYTPGDRSGVPLSLVRFAERPAPEVIADAVALSEYTAGVVASLLSLIGESTDPLTSRPFLLMQAVLMDRWRRGESLDLGELIRAVQEPGIDAIGVMPLETFYPSKERMALAMQLNGLLASPQWAHWADGVAMDIDAMLYTPQGRPRMAIVAIHHLEERERMMVVTLLLTRLVSWMRRQPGQSALRALVYMDEIAGFFPPVASPSSKAPMLTLLKQARAYGLGVVLATQNPADLDYKGLSNMGTWFIGHLQTAQDRERLLDGLVSAGTDRGTLSALLAKLPKRTFYVHNVHDAGPSLLLTRGTMSYLAGPLMGEVLKEWQEREVAHVAEADEAPSASDVAVTPQRAQAASPGGQSTTPPVAPEGMIHYYVPKAQPAHYEPRLLGVADVLFEDEKASVSKTRTLGFLAHVPTPPLPVDWEAAEVVDPAALSLSKRAPSGATFGALPEGLTPSARRNGEKRLKDQIYAKERLVLLYDPMTKLTQGVDESEKDFLVRVDGAQRELRDQQMAELKTSYAKKLGRLEEKVRKAELAVDREMTQADAAKQNTMVSVGSALLGGLLGRKVLSRTNLNQAGRSMRSLSRQKAQEADIDRAKENVDAVRSEVKALEAELEEKLLALQETMATAREQMERNEIKPKKMNIAVQDLLLVWVPVGEALAIAGR
ncbi:MAG: DUF87 domain-containing protein [Peptoniphilaceae bacterium]|nr:DUF87 domain-containing protein [Peptoniphilaceae bacterium]MDY6086049.1 DUF87 domain-containing protein [Peptoniphilaceae bacterium]